jgi:hypothetical protein
MTTTPNEPVEDPEVTDAPTENPDQDAEPPGNGITTPLDGTDLDDSTDDSTDSTAPEE